MCGRYALYAAGEEIWALFDLDGPPAPIEARYNVAPGQDVLVVGKRAGAPKPRASFVRWGLVPFFADDPRVGSKQLNARVETFDRRPAFRAAAERRRCLVPASGYYEWQKRADGSKVPHFVRPADGSLFAFAGLWERWKGPGGAPLFTCAVLTEPARGEVATIHDRMPVVLPRSAFAAWIDPTKGAEAVRREVLASRTMPAVEVFPVSSRVSSVANEGPENLERPAR